MNDHFIVCAGWKNGNPVIGECFIERTRGEEIVSFQFDKDWILNNHVIIDPELDLVTGRQYPKTKSVFGFLEDVSPDRWGRRLLERKELRDAAKNNRRTRTLLPSDYLLGVSDLGRMGGIRIRNTDGDFLCSDNPDSIPPITELRRLEEAVRYVEHNKGNTDTFLQDLLSPGSSLGGARPKANVKDVDGSMWIAKFPSKYDDYDIGAWEMVCHDLACLCGISVPPAKHIRLSDKGTTFLTKRFDRTDNGDRIHYASAMTMLGEHDNSNKKSSYLDILSILGVISSDFKNDERELYKRMVFNICVGNTDDHLRNHGFLLTEKGWKLSDAFDINPSLTANEQSLLIDFVDNSKSLELALSVSEYFDIKSNEALDIIKSMQNKIIQGLDYLPAKYKISKSEVRDMKDSFSECYQDINLNYSKNIEKANRKTSDSEPDTDIDI